MGLTANNIDSNFRDAVVVYAQASSLFDYSRFKSAGTSPRLSWDAIGDATNSLGLYGPGFSGFYDTLSALRANDADPEDI